MSFHYFRLQNQIKPIDGEQCENIDFVDAIMSD